MKKRYNLIILTALICISCNDNGSLRIENKKCLHHELIVKDMEKLFSCDRMLIGLDRDETLHSWYWDNLDLQPQTFFIGSYDTAMLAPDRVVVAVPPEKPTGNTSSPIILRNLASTKELDRWDLGPLWYVSRISASRNGKYIGLISEGKGANRRLIRLGYISIESGEMSWLTTLKSSIVDGPLIVFNRIALSDNGKYLAAVGLKEGGYIIVADIEEKKVLWDTKPSWAINFNDVCFSPDAKVVYIGGNGGVYCLDMATGNISVPWWETSARCVGVAASPDGQLVAGGMGGSGEVYVFDAKTGKVLSKFQTEQYTLYNLAFSPDSKFLATEGVKSTNIKIWKMPEPVKDSSKHK